LRIFGLCFGLAYVAAALLPSGVGHIARFSAFAGLIQTHSILPPIWARPVAAGVAVYELAIGGMAVGALSAVLPPRFAAWVFGAGVAVGCAFWLYVRRLLGGPVPLVSCGCLPVSGPLTPASLIPSVALVLVSVAGLAAMGLAPSAPMPLGLALLPILWGITLAGLIVLFVVAVPASAAGGRW
jgi:hypothetical protein